MAITLYQKEDFKGDSLSVSKDYEDLSTTTMGKNPSSMKMTATNDAIALFKSKNWKGECLYKRSSESINDLGKSSDGGEWGFGNTIASVRVTPFTLTLNFNILRTTAGDLPDDWTTANSTTHLNNIITFANSLLTDSKTLLKIDLGDVNFREDNTHFDLTDRERIAFPSSWKEEGRIDAIIVNSFEKDRTVGYGKFPCLGNYVVVSTQVRVGSTLSSLSDEIMAAVLVHEIGHYLGLKHTSADGDTDNFMYETTEERPILELKIKEEQISDIHTALARNLFRKEDRG